MRATAVVHLVRHVNGFEPFSTFMDSYEREPAGLEHDLVLLFKGFPGAAEQAPYRERAAPHAPRCIAVDDGGTDLAAYDAATAQLDHERVCLVNSFSEIVAPGWLGLLHDALRDGRAGAAGATASWGSQLSWRLFMLGAGGPYAQVYPDRRAAVAAMHAASGSAAPRAAKEWIVTLLTTLRRCRGLERFPARHLRTNAFLIDRALLAEMQIGRAQTKWQAFHVESGCASITRRLAARGRPPVVVDRGGVVRGPGEWHAADVFWQADQGAVLVADNQTRAYERASPDQRLVLSHFAWGPLARSATVAGGAPT